MKKTWQCPKCGGQRIGYLETVLGDGGNQAAAGKRLAGVKTGSVFGLELIEYRGGFEAFVCTECGYFEEYVKAPETVEWDKLRGFRWCRQP